MAEPAIGDVDICSRKGGKLPSAWHLPAPYAWSTRGFVPGTFYFKPGAVLRHRPQVQPVSASISPCLVRSARLTSPGNTPQRPIRYREYWPASSPAVSSGPARGAPHRATPAGQLYAIAEVRDMGMNTINDRAVAGTATSNLK